ncbi:MAG TPA: serine hydrolase domain-containing protein [Streptosporangiaceae bacterium]|nr:serine hydrolase domain-containing protein [Streptosporangiaceae bacterium]
MMPIEADALEVIAARFAARGGQPGLAYGVIASGELVHAGGHGESWRGGPAPDADTVFRIASMTKSFTAALVLMLRDRGALRLDDPAVEHVAPLRGVAAPAPDSPPITIRHLLTMTAGFPTDDPWGDRQQGLDPAAFARLLADGGIRAAWAPGTKFEYSNLGYAVLGMVIESVTGVRYADAMQTEVLGLLGLNRTGYEAADVDPARLARGYRRDGGEWVEVELDPYGAFAPMGGIFSCVRDLARWIAGFTGAFLPASARAAGFDHPLSTLSRREMQLGQVVITDERSAVVARLSGPASLSYGFGLFAEDDPAFGTIVQHSGGYPGFGSQMRWHPASGLGTVVLANSTYAPAGALAGELLSALLTAQIKQDRERGRYQLRGPLPGGEPWPATLTARAAVADLLAAWNADAAARIFAPNIELDRPLAQRQADIERLRERIGAFATDPGRPAEFDSPAHCRWWLTGSAGTVAVQIKLAPLRQALVQELAIAIPAARGSALAEALDRLIGAVNAAVPCWPAGLRTADGFDADHGERQLRAAAAWAGQCALDCYLAGNGDTSATVRLTGPTGSVVLALEIGDSGLLRRSEVTLLG